MKIVYLDEAAVNLSGDINYDSCNEIGELTLFDHTPTDVIIDRSKDADLLIVNKVKITKEVLQELPDLRHVAVSATGYNNVDVKACRQANVSVSNVPGYSTDSVAQHIFSMVLNLATMTFQYDRDVRQGEWQKSKVFTLLKYPTFELKGKVMGVVGFGAIGKEVARLAAAFGMKVLVNRVSSNEVGSYEFASLSDLLQNSDVVSLCCPLTDSNHEMINRNTLKMMKQTALLVNTARGPLVNEADLVVALKEGWIGGAGLDVLVDEPPGNTPLLSDLPNLLITPHSAWSTLEARQRLINEVALNLRSFVSGNSRNVVN